MEESSARHAELIHDDRSVSPSYSYSVSPEPHEARTQSPVRWVKPPTKPMATLPTKIEERQTPSRGRYHDRQSGSNPLALARIEDSRNFTEARTPTKHFQEKNRHVNSDNKQEKRPPLRMRSRSPHRHHSQGQQRRTQPSSNNLPTNMQARHEVSRSSNHRETHESSSHRHHRSSQHSYQHKEQTCKHVHRSRSPRRKTPENSDRSLPAHFKPDKDCLDSQGGKYKLPLLRQIPDTSSAQERSMVGKSIMELKLIDLYKNGLDNYVVRYISAGRWFDLQLMKSFKESCVIQGIVAGMRTEPAFDLDGVVANFMVTTNQPFGTKEEKQKGYALFAKDVFSYINKGAKTANNNDSLLQQIKKLTEELEEAKKQSIAPAPKIEPKPKRLSQQQKLKDAFGAKNLHNINNTSDKLPLKTDDLKNSRKSTLNDWSAKNMPADQKTKDAVNKLYTQLTTEFEALPEDDKENILEQIALTYGLPLKVSTNANKQALTKAICIALHLVQ